MTANRRLLASLVGAVLLTSVPATAPAAATIIINNINGPGVGFNDPTPVAPVGGNPGTTLGQQRLIAFQHAASIWGASLNSVVPIVVQAQFTALSCNATGAVLGSAGPIYIVRDFTGAPLPGTWYHAALGDKLFGAETNPGPSDIAANFNVNLGNPGCLTGIPFYLGLDNNHGTAIDLVAVLLHEFGHGLGFSTTTSGTSGAFFGGFPSAYDAFAFDNTQGLFWNAMTNAQRVVSAVNSRQLAWTGVNAVANVPVVLQGGTPQLEVSSPPSVAGTYLVGTASFGPPLTAAGQMGEVMPVADQGAGPGCTPFNAANTFAVNGKIALIDRGVCAFTVKVLNAQNAGAIGVIIADNVAGSPPPGLGGTDPNISIPAIRITLADANALKSALRFRSRGRSGMFANMTLDLSVYAGADAAGRPLLFTPNPFQGGSSVSHWDTIATPNLLMEPSINGDLTHSVGPPQDLTLPMLQDLGW